MTTSTHADVIGKIREMQRRALEEPSIVIDDEPDDQDVDTDDEPEVYTRAPVVPRVMLAGVGAWAGLVILLGIMASCTPEQRAAAAPWVSAAGNVACKLSPLVAPGDSGAIVGAVCSDLAQAAAGILAATGKPRELAACRELVPIVIGERQVGAACPAYAATLAKGLGGRTP